VRQFSGAAFGVSALFIPESPHAALQQQLDACSPKTKQKQSAMQCVKSLIILHNLHYFIH